MRQSNDKAMNVGLLRREVLKVIDSISRQVKAQTPERFGLKRTGEALGFGDGIEIRIITPAVILQANHQASSLQRRSDLQVAFEPRLLVAVEHNIRGNLVDR